MTDKQQTASFADELDKLIERFRSEYDMSYAQVVGVLEFKKWLLCSEVSEESEENDEE